MTHLDIGIDTRPRTNRAPVPRYSADATAAQRVRDLRIDMTAVEPAFAREALVSRGRDKGWIGLPWLLTAIIDRFSGGPVGLETLAAALSEDTETIEDVYEPYLMQEGYLKRTPRGRVVTEHAYRHVGRTPPAEATLWNAAQPDDASREE